MDPYQQPESPTSLTDEDQQLGAQKPVVEPTYQTPETNFTQPLSTPVSTAPVMAVETPETINQSAVTPIVPTTPLLSVQSDVVSTTPTENLAPAGGVAPAKKSVRLWLWLGLAFVVLVLVILVVVLYVIK